MRVANMLMSKLHSAGEKWALRARSENGQGTMEYVLILVMIVIFVVGILIFFRDDIQSIIERAQDIVQGWLGDVEGEIA